MKIKVKALNSNCKFEINPKGDCIDLKAAQDYTFKSPYSNREHQVNNVKIRDVVFDEQMIELGIAMKLPKGIVARVLPRSSTTKKMGLVAATSGFIDTTYSGNDDTWKFYCFSVRATEIKEGDRICQFELRPSMFANTWQWLKWIFKKNIEFEWVDDLGTNENRGGHGSTGVA